MQVRGWECTGSWEGTQSEQLTQTNQRDTPHHTAPRSTSKPGGMGEGVTLGAIAFILTINPHECWASISQEGLNTCLWQAGANESTVQLCLHTQLLLYLVSYLHLNLRVLPLLHFLFPPSSHLGSKWSAVWCWAAWQVTPQWPTLLSTITKTCPNIITNCSSKTSTSARFIKCMAKKERQWWRFICCHSVMSSSYHTVFC